MTARGAVTCLCALGALLAGAVPAHGAIHGTTAFTCKEEKGGGSFADPHCKEAKSEGSYAHVAIVENTTTEISVSNETTGGSTQSFKYKYSMAGIAFTLTATGVTGTGWMENSVSGEEHYAHGEVALTFTGVTVSGPSGCKAYAHTGEGGMGEAGVITTDTLVVTTKGQGDALRIDPKEGNILARYFLTGCKLEALNGTDTVRGGIIGAPSGATLGISVEGLNGNPGTTSGGGAEGTLTVKAKNPNVAEDTYKPISPTTVET
jgi:hypothetical protein